MKINYKVLISIVAVSSILGIAVNYFSPGGISLLQDNMQSGSPVNTPPKAGQPDAEHITVAQAYNLYKQGALFFDAREESDYMAGHIHKAVSFPLTRFGLLTERLAEYDKDRVIITYCSGSSCNLSVALADKLKQAGYKNVYVFFGGWNDWLTNNYPLIMNGQLYNAEG